MQQLKIFIWLIFLVTDNSSIQAQSNLQLYKRIKFPYDTVGLYLGDVDGVTAQEYKKLRKHSKNEDKLLGLKDLTKSEYDIEIRLYEESDGARLVQDYYCTRLFLDTILKLDRKSGLRDFMLDSLQRIIVDDKSINLLNADSIFISFAGSNIFSIQQRKYLRFNEAVLVNKKLVNTQLVGLNCPHCKSYRFEYKIGSIYNSIYLEFMSGYDPQDTNFDDFTRKKKIIMNALRTKSHIELRK